MAVRLAPDDVAALQRASTVLLSPFSYESSDAWRRAACSEVERALGGNGSSFALPVAGETLVGGAPDIVSALRVLDPPPDWLIRALTVRRRSLRVDVADWLELHDVDALRRTAFYNDVVRPNRFLAPIALMTDIRQSPLPAVLAVCNETERVGRARVERGKAMLQLLLPAFRSGVTTYLGLRQQRETLLSLGEAARVGLALFDAAGRLLHQNEYLVRAIAADVERQRILREIAFIAATVGGKGARRGQGFVGCETVSCEIRTVCGRYAISSTFLEGGWAGIGSAVMVMVECLTAKAIDNGELKKRFHLTAREIDVAMLLRRGMSSRGIATALGISVNTARRHTERILVKLDVHSKGAAVSTLVGN